VVDLFRLLVHAVCERSFGPYVQHGTRSAALPKDSHLGGVTLAQVGRRLLGGSAAARSCCGRRNDWRALQVQ
jgi:topoisomerase IA-like protein